MIILFRYCSFVLQFLSVQQQQMRPHTDTGASSLMASVQRAGARCGIVGCLLHFIGFYAFYFMLMFLLLNFPEFSFTFFVLRFATLYA